MIYRHFITMTLALGCAGSAFTSEAALQELKDKCEAAREARLAPEREAMIQACIKEKNKTYAIAPFMPMCS